MDGYIRQARFLTCYNVAVAVLGAVLFLLGHIPGGRLTLEKALNSRSIKKSVLCLIRQAFCDIMNGTDLPTYLILLLKAVAVRRFHQVDVLQEVGHSDGRMQLPSLVRRFGPLTVVSSDIQKAAALCSRTTVVLV